MRRSHSSSVRHLTATLLCAAPLGLALFSSPASAQVPGYTLEQKARFNILGNPGGSYRVPEGASLNSEPVAINDARQVAVTVGVTTGSNSGLFFDPGNGGAIVWESSGEVSMGSASLSEAGTVAYVLDGVGSPGVYTWSQGSGSGLATDGPEGAYSWSSIALNAAGSIAFRARVDSGQVLALYDGANAQVIAQEGTDIDFLFSPDLNDAGHLAAKVMTDAGNEEIRLFRSAADVVTLLQTNDVDASSPFVDLDNSLALNGSDEVAFVGELADGSRQVAIVDAAGAITPIATEGQGGLQEIDFFAPDLNDAGLVTFRGVADDGLSAIFVADATSMAAVVKEHGLVDTDAGQAKLDQNTPDQPIFAAAPKINNRGDIAFAAGVTPVTDNQTEWGTAVIVALSDAAPIDGGADAGHGADAGAGGGSPDGGAQGGADAGAVDNGGGGGTGGTGSPGSGIGGGGGSADDEGCGCAAAGGIGGGAGGSALLLLLGLVGLRLRRRRSLR